MNHRAPSIPCWAEIHGLALRDHDRHGHVLEAPFTFVAYPGKADSDGVLPSRAPARYGATGTDPWLQFDLAATGDRDRVDKAFPIT